MRLESYPYDLISLMADFWFEDNRAISPRQASRLCARSPHPCHFRQHPAYPTKLIATFKDEDHAARFVSAYHGTPHQNTRVLLAPHPPYVPCESDRVNVLIAGTDESVTKRELAHIFRSFPGFVSIVETEDDRELLRIAVFDSWAGDSSRELKTRYPPYIVLKRQKTLPRYLKNAREENIWRSSFFSARRAK